MVGPHFFVFLTFWALFCALAFSCAMSKLVADSNENTLDYRDLVCRAFVVTVSVLSIMVWIVTLFS
jgi:hypothetical protein